ncbi:MAG TPA: ribosome maturation factor RimM [Solirubrobacteraceae bacterium]|nr:ribosome maturation factor RimM [Solirubrobacteraceae bacterium]
MSAGRVGRPHGLDGSFVVTQPRATLLALGGSVRVGAADREIVRSAGTPGRPILRLDGVDDRAGAEALRGEELLVARAAAPPLPPGEYWAEDLEGCAVVTPDGRELGRVDQLRALPSCEVLEVGELLVPMVADAVLEISPEQRRIVVDPGFLGLTGEPEGGARPEPERALRRQAGEDDPGARSEAPPRGRAGEDDPGARPEAAPRRQAGEDDPGGRPEAAPCGRAGEDDPRGRPAPGTESDPGGS